MTKVILSLVLAIVLALQSQAQELSKDAYLAFNHDNPSALKSQLEYKNLNQCYESGTTSYTLLALSIKTGATQCFNLLVSEENSDLNKYCSGKTPLLYAAKYGKLNMLKKLLAAGADPTITHKNRSALDYAKKYKQKEIVAYLEKL